MRGGKMGLDWGGWVRSDRGISDGQVGMYQSYRA